MYIKRNGTGTRQINNGSHDRQDSSVPFRLGSGRSADTQSGLLPRIRTHGQLRHDQGKRNPLSLLSSFPFFFFSSISRRDRSNREFNSFILFLPSQFLGVWYEAERYFQLTEVVSRCVMANYTLGADGKFRVSNEVTNRL